MGYMTDESKKPPTDEELKARSLSRWENEGGAKRAMPQHQRVAPASLLGLAKRHRQRH